LQQILIKGKNQLLVYTFDFSLLLFLLVAFIWKSLFCICQAFIALSLTFSLASYGKSFTPTKQPTSEK